MRSVIAVGVCMARPPWPKASRSWADVSIFASMLVTSASNRCIHVGYGFDGAGSRRNASATKGTSMSRDVGRGRGQSACYLERSQSQMGVEEQRATEALDRAR